MNFINLPEAILQNAGVRKPKRGYAQYLNQLITDLTTDIATNDATIHRRNHELYLHAGLVYQTRQKLIRAGYTPTPGVTTLHLRTAGRVNALLQRMDDLNMIQGTLEEILGDFDESGKDMKLQKLNLEDLLGQERKRVGLEDSTIKRWAEDVRKACWGRG